MQIVEPKPIESNEGNHPKSTERLEPSRNEHNDTSKPPFCPYQLLDQVVTWTAAVIWSILLIEGAATVALRSLEAIIATFRVTFGL